MIFIKSLTNFSLYNDRIKTIIPINMKKLILTTAFLTFCMSMIWSQGFTISGTQLIDANGKPFMQRGFAVPLSWFVSDVSSNIANIRKNSNANCLRIVMNTTTADADWQNCVISCIANKMIPEVELHDVTCDTASSSLAAMANWWVSKKSFLTRPDIARYILINIANEWGDWAMAKNSPVSWRNAYLNAVSIMRKGGIKTTLVIDAPDCGQDLYNGSTLKSYAMDVFNSDSLKNCLFTLHLYGEWATGGGSNPENLPSLKKAGIPIIVGEFAASVNDTAVMNTCQRNSIGWMAWSWKGNSDPTYTDMSYDWAGNILTLWGNTAINDPNGLKNTAHIASVFAGDSGCIPTTINPYLQVNGGVMTETANAIVNVGDSIVLAPQPLTDTTWAWTGPNGFSLTFREFTLGNIQPNQGGYYLVSYTNANSCTSDTAIKISVVACNPVDTTILSGATYKILSKYSGMSLAVANSSIADGALIQQMDPVDSTNQEWVIDSISNGIYEIISVNSGKALNVVGSSVIIGANIEQRTDSILLISQKWQFIKDKNGYFQIRNNHSKLCMDIFSASTDSGTGIVQFTSDNYDDQKFSLTKLKNPSNIAVNTYNNVTVFPNPNCDGEFKITYTNLTGNPLMEIYDMQGKLRYKRTLSETNTTISSGLTTGVYVLKIINDQNFISRKLIVK
jgi:mannan endo-1,4-beta-mannosidase